jgi:hypothetical protein
VAAAVQAVVDVEVIGFHVSSEHSPSDTLLELGLPPGQMVLPASDLVAAVAALDQQRKERGAMRARNGLAIRSGAAYSRIGWSDRSVDAVVVEITGSLGPYNEAYCQLPELTGLGGAGLGSDLSRIGECSPKLEWLSIADWSEATGHEGLAGLANLRELVISGSVGDVDAVPALPSLEVLRLHLAVDTPENRARLALRLPGCHIIYNK